MASKEMAGALAAAKRALKGNPDVVSVGLGYKYKDGRRTDQVCIVVGVRKKLPATEVAAGRLAPAAVAGGPTGVIQCGEVKAHALVSRRRPCPPGYSIGHPLVTAGTLGAWVRRGSANERYILSNNHVIAASNDGAPGDFTRQPGRADGGTDNDRFARLTDYVRIGFDGGDADGKKQMGTRYPI